MKKLELIKMLENVDDNAELTFVVEGRDRDGYPEDNKVNVYKVLGGEVVRVRGEYGIHRYENLTDEYGTARNVELSQNAEKNKILKEINEILSGMETQSLEILLAKLS